MSTRRAGAPASIWPGPECLMSDAERSVARANVLVRFGYNLATARSLVRGFETAAALNSANRIAGIARGHARARARMQRFRDWIYDQPACGERGDVIWATRRAPSPEAAVRVLALMGDGPTLRWLAVRVGYDDWVRLCDATTSYLQRGAKIDEAVDHMLRLGVHVENKRAGRAWTALPWQREAGR